jgi:hypothetical protein
MTEAEAEAHLEAVMKINGVKTQGDKTTRRFKGHRKNKP